MSIQLVLGQEVEEGLVVRLVSQRSIFEDQKGITLVTESYAEIRKNDGTPEFVLISKDEQPFSDKKSKIRALDPFWRPKW